MNSTSFNEMIEPYLDGDLDADSLALFEAELAGNSDLQHQLDLAMDLQGRLAELPRYRMPERAIDAITQQTEQRRPSWITGLAVAASVLFSVLLLLQFGPSIDTPSGELVENSAGVSDEELREAREQLGVALAYLDRAGDVVGQEVGNIWVDQGIVRPVNTGIQQSTEHMLRTAGAGESRS